MNIITTWNNWNSPAPGQMSQTRQQHHPPCTTELWYWLMNIITAYNSLRLICAAFYTDHSRKNRNTFPLPPWTIPTYLYTHVYVQQPSVVGVCILFTCSHSVIDTNWLTSLFTTIGCRSIFSKPNSAYVCIYCILSLLVSSPSFFHISSAFENITRRDNLSPVLDQLCLSGMYILHGM